MLDETVALRGLAAMGLDTWQASLAPLVSRRLEDGAHGKLPRWREILASLPLDRDHPAALDQTVVTVGPARFTPGMRAGVRTALLGLSPWRKGPFAVGDLLVDAEWRSDRKWARLENAITPLGGRRVLDVGCGNGYYALRMCGAGAAAVLGIDPTLAHLAQFEAIRRWLPPVPAWLLPLRLQELPPDSRCFDSVFSMGVLYHQREPLEHLAQLHAALRPGGELVLETLVLPGEAPAVRQPEHRYARMRNVWRLPTISQLSAWLEQQNFANHELVDVSRTTTDEQRSTEWMPFESLAEALDPDDASRTVEGWPAPRRALVVATAG